MPAKSVTLFRRREQVVLPSNAVFLCAYDLDIVVDRVPEAAFLVRDARNELWLANPDPSTLEHLGRNDCPVGTEASFVAAIPFNAEPVEAARRLVEAHVEAQALYVWPASFLVEGVLSRRDFDLIVQRVKRRLSARRQRASSFDRSSIVIMARELGLNPRPSGTGDTAWLANCPGTNHFLMIGIASGDFGCGWCKWRGGIEDLRAFTEERRRKASNGALSTRQALVSK